MRIQYLFLVGLCLTVPMLQAQDAATTKDIKPTMQVPADPNWPSIPADKMSKPGWGERHAAILAQEKTQQPELLFIGDSITAQWSAMGTTPATDYAGVFKHFYGDRNAMNLGFGGDTTANVLWRIENGEVDGIHPKAAVLLIGTNNDAPTPPAQPAATTAAIELIVKVLHQKQPQMKVLVLGILPKDATADRLANDAAVNAALAHDLASDQLVKVMDVGPVFFKDGKLDVSLYKDPVVNPGHRALHPTAIGQRLIAVAMEPTLAQMLGAKPKQ